MADRLHAEGESRAGSAYRAGLTGVTLGGVLILWGLLARYVVWRPATGAAEGPFWAFPTFVALGLAAAICGIVGLVLARRAHGHVGRSARRLSVAALALVALFFLVILQIMQRTR